MKKDISANLYQKSLILCSKITINVLHNTSSAVLLPWQCTGFQTSQILKALLATYMYSVPFWYLHMVPTKFQWSVMQIGQDSSIDIHVLHIYLVECMMSWAISFAYFTHFSSTNTSGTNAGIYKQWTAFLFFHEILCDTPNKSRGKAWNHGLLRTLLR